MGHSLLANKTFMLGGAAVASLLIAGCSVAMAQTDDEIGAVLEIDGFVGTVEIKSGPKLGYQLDMKDNLVAKPVIESSAGRLSIASDKVDIRNCRINNRKFQLKVKGGELTELTHFPKMTVTLPENSDALIHLNSGLLTMGDSRNLDLNFTGCGDLTFGNVAESLDVAIKGSGDVAGKRAGEANISIKGSGDFDIGHVTGPVNLQIVGSGDADFDRINGDFKIDLMGSGDVETAFVEGEISIRLKGSGDIKIDDGTAKNFSANVFGSGDVEFKGTADDVSVLLKGSGDVYVARLTGKKVVERHGSGDVRIGAWSSDDED